MRAIRRSIHIHHRCPQLLVSSQHPSGTQGTAHGIWFQMSLPFTSTQISSIGNHVSMRHTSKMPQLLYTNVKACSTPTNCTTNLVHVGTPYQPTSFLLHPVRQLSKNTSKHNARLLKSLTFLRRVIPMNAAEQYMTSGRPPKDCTCVSPVKGASDALSNPQAGILERGPGHTTQSTGFGGDPGDDLAEGGGPTPASLQDKRAEGGSHRRCLRSRVLKNPLAGLDIIKNTSDRGDM